MDVFRFYLGLRFLGYKGYVCFCVFLTFIFSRYLVGVSGCRGRGNMFRDGCLFTFRDFIGRRFWLGGVVVGVVYSVYAFRFRYRFAFRVLGLWCRIVACRLR